MFGALLALLASATFALANVSTRRGVLTGSVLQALVVTVWLGVPVFVAAVFVAAVLIAGELGAIGRFPRAAVVYLSVAGVIHFVLGRYCNYRAINAIGVNLTGPLQETSLLVSMVLAVWLLGEVLTGLKILGILLVLLGPAIIMRVMRNERRAGSGSTVAAPDAEGSNPPQFRPRFAEGYTFAALSAIAYGVSPVLVRAGLRDTDPGVGVAGGLLSYVAASLFVAPVLLHPKTR